MFPDWQKRSNPKSNVDDAAKVPYMNEQNPSSGANLETNLVEVKPDTYPKTERSEDNVEVPVTETLPQTQPPQQTPSVGETANNPTEERAEMVDDVVETGADKVAKVVDDNGDASRDRPQDLPITQNPEEIEKDTITEAVGETQEPVGSTEAEEANPIVEQVGADPLESSTTGTTQPQLASLSTTLESSILTSSIVSTQPRERRESQPSLLPPASPSSPMEPPILPFTAFSLPTSPSHTASTLTFSPITPAPSILHPPAPPLATPRPQMAPPAPAPLPPLLPSSSSLQHAPSTAFSLPTLPPAPSHILPSSSPSKDEGGVETV